MKTIHIHLNASWTMRGFTLIEVMVTLAIVAILAAIAYPSYIRHVRTANRLEAKANLMEATQFMERSFTASNSYVVALPAGLAVSPRIGTPQYAIAFTPNQPTANTYIIQATPITPAQQQDICGTLSISNTGVTTPAIAGCW
jgi:type IV pilus assembly protein PilE